MRHTATPLVLVKLFVLLVWAPGCATYEHELIRPPELKQHIGRSSDVVVTVEPLEYRMRSVENRLVINVHNPTSDTIELIGPTSSIVDPNGQSHPLFSQSIAPASFIRLIFPPMRPFAHPRSRSRVNMGVGVGVRVQRDVPASPYAHRPDRQPRYLVLFDEEEDDDAYYWDWKGQSDVRVYLTFRRGGSEFRHEFAFRRFRV